MLLVQSVIVISNQRLCFVEVKGAWIDYRFTISTLLFQKSEFDYFQTDFE